VFGLLDLHLNLRQPTSAVVRPDMLPAAPRDPPSAAARRCCRGGAWDTLAAVQRILVATDSDAVYDEVDAALGGPDCVVDRVRAGTAVRAKVIEDEPDLVMLDLQIGEMGGVAACLDLRLEESGDRLPPQKIVLLLDRDADLFLARRAGADGWLVKPVDAGRLRRAVAAVLAGEVWREKDVAPA
jgi:DNA-binding response OmpR family regulator